MDIKERVENINKKIQEMEKQIKIIKQSDMYEYEKIGLINRIQKEIKEMEGK